MCDIKRQYTSEITFSDCAFRDCSQSLRVKSIKVPPRPRYARSLSNPSNYSITLSRERCWGEGGSGAAAPGSRVQGEAKLAPK